MYSHSACFRGLKQGYICWKSCCVCWVTLCYDGDVLVLVDILQHNGIIKGHFAYWVSPRVSVQTHFLFSLSWRITIGVGLKVTCDKYLYSSTIKLLSIEVFPFFNWGTLWLIFNCNYICCILVSSQNLVGRKRKPSTGIWWSEVGRVEEGLLYLSPKFEGLSEWIQSEGWSTQPVLIVTSRPLTMLSVFLICILIDGCHQERDKLCDQLHWKKFWQHHDRGLPVGTKNGNVNWPWNI